MTGEKLPRNPHLFNHFFEIAWRNINVPDWPLTTASESQDTKGHQNNTKRFPRHGIPCRYRPRTSAQTAHSLRLAIGGGTCPAQRQDTPPVFAFFAPSRLRVRQKERLRAFA